LVEEKKPAAGQVSRIPAASSSHAYYHSKGGFRGNLKGCVSSYFGPKKGK